MPPSNRHHHHTYNWQDKRKRAAAAAAAVQQYLSEKGYYFCAVQSFQLMMVAQLWTTLCRKRRSSSATPFYIRCCRVGSGTASASSFANYRKCMRRKLFKNGTTYFMQLYWFPSNCFILSGSRISLVSCLHILNGHLFLFRPKGDQPGKGLWPKSFPAPAPAPGAVPSAQRGRLGRPFAV